MPATDRQTEEQLKDFLAWEAAKRREGKTIDAVLEKQESIMVAVRRIAKDRLADKAKLETHGRAIKTLQHQVALLTNVSPQTPDWRPAKEEITGTHSLKEIAAAQAKLEEEWEEKQEREREEEEDRKKRELDQTTWWKRQGWIWAFAVVTLVVGASISGCVSYAIHRLEQAEAPAARKP